MKESDLFEPIKIHFETLGFKVDGEVGDCDMLMTDGQEHIVIELKNDLNFKLFLQGVKRQKVFEKVYLAIWSPKNLSSKLFRDKVYLLNRLGLGLILVSKRAKKVNIYYEPIVHPVENYRIRNKKVKKRNIKELNGRRSRNNVGGVKGKKILTAYKEDSLLVLDILEKEGELKASIIKSKTGIDRAYDIVYNNYNDWFVKVDKGIYGLTEKGHNACKDNTLLIEKMKKSETDS